jgi:hypothetical protein
MFEKLPKTKSKNGYIYTQVLRNTKAAIYKGRNEKCPEDTSTFFEVFKIKVCKPYSLVQKYGKKKGEVYSYPAAEKFPGDSEFGITAWTFNSEDLAKNKFQEISK